MSILITGMEMPDNCFHCSFCRNDLSSPSRLYVDCTATDSTIIECDYEGSEEAWRKLHDGRQELCPLVEVTDSRWIPVTERLPEDREMVIGFTPCDGFMFVGFHVTSLYHDRDFSYWNIVTAMRSTKQMTKKVTHWMPLPEPPKEDGEQWKS